MYKINHLEKRILLCNLSSTVSTIWYIVLLTFLMFETYLQAQWQNLATLFLELQITRNGPTPRCRTARGGEGRKQFSLSLLYVVWYPSPVTVIPASFRVRENQSRKKISTTDEGENKQRSTNSKIMINEFKYHITFHRTYRGHFKSFELENYRIADR